MGHWYWYFIGDARTTWSIHDSKSWIGPYSFLKFMEGIFRGIAQVCFANNPYSGLLILAGLFLADWKVGAAAVLSPAVAVIMSKILNQPDSLVVSGLQSYSAVLVGTVTMSLYQLFFNSPITWHVWAGVIVMSAFSVPVGLGLAALLSPVKLPVYTLPFNVTTSLMFLAFQSAGFRTPGVVPESVINSADSDLNLNSVNDSNEDPDLNQVMLGVLKAAGQVYAVETTPGSVLILVGLALNSPYLTVVSFLGGLVSSMTGLAVTAFPYSGVYGGVWGYNGFLSAGCLAFFVKPNWLSFLLALLNAIFSVFIMNGLSIVFGENNLPVFTYPFCISSLLFLPLVDLIPGVERESNLTFPEDHFWRQRKESRPKSDIENTPARGSENPGFVEDSTISSIRL